MAAVSNVVFFVLAGMFFDGLAMISRFPGKWMYVCVSGSSFIGGFMYIEAFNCEICMYIHIMYDIVYVL